MIKRPWLFPVCVFLGALFLGSPRSPGIETGQPDPSSRKLKVVVFGGHPDDPESGAGGLVASLTEAGHEVILAYGTTFRGDRQFFGRPEGEVRREEATAACRVLRIAQVFSLRA